MGYYYFLQCGNWWLLYSNEGRNIFTESPVWMWSLTPTVYIFGGVVLLLIGSLKENWRYLEKYLVCLWIIMSVIVGLNIGSILYDGNKNKGFGSIKGNAIFYILLLIIAVGGFTQLLRANFKYNQKIITDTDTPKYTQLTFHNTWVYPCPIILMVIVTIYINLVFGISRTSILSNLLVLDSFPC